MTAELKPPRRFPLERRTEDDRFSFGLLVDVIAVLEKHGYPPAEHGDDLVNLQLALFKFLYR